MHILVTAGVDRFANPGRFTMAPQARQRPQSDVKQMVHRRCRVCEREADLIEVLGTEGDCPWCHAPTAVSVVLPPAGGPDAAGDAKGVVGVAGAEVVGHDLLANQAKDAARDGCQTEDAGRPRQAWGSGGSIGIGHQLTEA